MDIVTSTFLIGFFVFVPVAIVVIYSAKKIIKNHKKSSAQFDSKEQKKKDPLPPDEGYSSIEQEIQEVIWWIGVSEPVNTSAMFEDVLDGREDKVVGEIAKQLSLPMKVTIKKSSEEKHGKDGSCPLAEVSIGNVPKFGSKDFENFPCVITYYPGYNSKPDRFIYVTAHELCHYVLHSLRPGLLDTNKEERLTDLAVIFSGFESAYRTGWDSCVNGNAGYFGDEQKIEYICKRYKSILAERRIKFENIIERYNRVLKQKSDVLLFAKMCGLLLSHQDEKIDKEDMESISRCLSLIKWEEVKDLEKLQKSLSSVNSYGRYGDADFYGESIDKFESILKGIDLPIMSDIVVLAKYTDKYS